jgi:hypothetical protein
MPVVKVSPGQSGSSGGLVGYLEKENKDKEVNSKELWFNQDKSNIRPDEAEFKIDNQKERLSNTEAKFYEVYVAFSKDELNHIDKLSGGNLQQKKETVKDICRYIMEQYATNFNKGLQAKNFNYVAKLEENRTYKGTGEEVRNGKAKSGDKKPGDNMHVHILVSRNAYTDEKKLTKCSPQASAKGDKDTGKINGKIVQKGFNRNEFKLRSEQVFDEKTGYKRAIEHSFKYLNAMKNGSLEDQISALRNSIKQPQITSPTIREIPEELFLKKGRRMGL